MQIGRAGEDIAADFYMQKGYRLVARNFQYYHKGSQGRWGEIYLILQGGGILVLVEVKTRSDTQFGLPVAQINQRKLRYLFKSYQYFLTKYEHDSFRWRTQNNNNLRSAAIN